MSNCQISSRSFDRQTETRWCRFCMYFWKYLAVRINTYRCAALPRLFDKFRRISRPHCNFTKHRSVRIIKYWTDRYNFRRSFILTNEILNTVILFYEKCPRTISNSALWTMITFIVRPYQVCFRPVREPFRSYSVSFSCKIAQKTIVF